MSLEYQVGNPACPAQDFYEYQPKFSSVFLRPIEHGRFLFYSHSHRLIRVFNQSNYLRHVTEGNRGTSDQELIPKWASGFWIFSSRSVKSLVSRALLIANMAACKEASSMLISEANKPPIFEKTGSWILYLSRASYNGISNIDGRSHFV